MNNHALESLKTREDLFGWPHVYDGDGERLTNDRPAFSLDEWKAICRRIVACVNACAKISTDLLESMGAGSLMPVDDANREAKKRADTAEAALEEAVGLLRELDDVCQAAPPVDLIQRVSDVAGKTRAFLARMEKK